MLQKTKNSERTEEEFKLSKCELEKLLQKASEKGARTALASIGLHDDHAHIDIRDLRELMRAFRMAKKDSFRVFIKLLVSGLAMLILAGFFTLLGDNLKIK